MTLPDGRIALVVQAEDARWVRKALTVAAAAFLRSPHPDALPRASRFRRYAEDLLDAYHQR